MYNGQLTQNCMCTIELH